MIGAAEVLRVLGQPVQRRAPLISVNFASQSALASSGTNGSEWNLTDFCTWFLAGVRSGVTIIWFCFWPMTRSALEMADDWYYAKDGQPHGPISETHLRRLVAIGEVLPHDLVWQEGFPEWVAAQSIPTRLPAVPQAADAPPGAARAEDQSPSGWMALGLLAVLVALSVYAGWERFLSGIILVVAIFAVFGALLAAWLAVREPRRDRKTRLGLVAGACVVLAIGAAVLRPQSSASNQMTGTAGQGLGNAPSVGTTNALTLSSEQLALATMTVETYWEENDPLGPETFRATGTAFVRHRSNGKLILYTNSHVLGLGKLAGADGDGRPEVGKYWITVTFPTGKKRRVARMAESNTNSVVDMAQLELSAADLVEGTDYVIVPYDPSFAAHVGSDVVAVGSPLGLAGTQTKGSISALRPHSSYRQLTVIQHWAPINPGNSGGPLFCERDGRMHWIGVNTWRLEEAQGIFFAIPAKEFENNSFSWASCDPTGAVQLLGMMYNTRAIVER